MNHATFQRQELQSSVTTKTYEAPYPSLTPTLLLFVVNTKILTLSKKMIDDKRNPFKCEFCPKDFVLSYNLKLHVRIHTGEKPFKCGTCGKAFTQRHHLKVHMNVHNGGQHSKCVICDKEVLSNYLKRHLNRQTWGINFNGIEIS